jgi:hypothetical protein
LARQRPQGLAEPLAKLQISVDFSAGFGRNMLQDVVNCNFSAGDVRKCWVNLEISRILPIFARVIDFSRLPKQG